MPALFVDAGRQVAELGLFSSMMGGWWSPGIAIHASVGARYQRRTGWRWHFVALRWARFCFHSCGRAGADVVGRARGLLTGSILPSQRCHLQPHAARTSRPGTRHGLGGDAVSLAHGYCLRSARLSTLLVRSPASLYRAVFAGLVALLALQFCYNGGGSQPPPQPIQKVNTDAPPQAQVR